MFKKKIASMVSDHRVSLPYVTDHSICSKVETVQCLICSGSLQEITIPAHGKMECGTALIVFAGLVRLRPVYPFSSEAGMWVSELIITNKACSGSYYVTTTEKLD